MAEQRRPNLSKSDLDVIRVMNNPPQLVKETMVATLLLLGHPEHLAKDWAFAKKLCAKFGNESLLYQLSNIDVSNVSADAAAKANEVSKQVDADKVKSVCMACHGLHQWNLNVIKAVQGSAGGEKTG